jgi:hypothetical protein
VWQSGGAIIICFVRLPRRFAPRNDDSAMTATVFDVTDILPQMKYTISKSLEFLSVFVVRKAMHISTLIVL